MDEIIIPDNIFPLISVIIPVYNGEKYIKYSLRSVQKQRMKSTEIIIVDDNSNDDSIKIIKNYMKKDKRIKLIKNKVNKRILFCKSIGALNSKGKYIIELDQDDMFITDAAFDIMINESEKYDSDLLSFEFISGNNAFTKIRKINNFHENKNVILQQPDLKHTIFKTNNCLLWRHLIRANLYKKVIYHLWSIIINYKIIFQEDFLITFFLYIYAKKLLQIEKKLFFHFKNKESTSNNYENNSEYFLSILFAGNIFFDYYFDYHPNDTPIIMNYIYFLIPHLENAKKLHKSFFNYFFRKIMRNNYLTIENKIWLMKTFNITENFHYYNYVNINKTYFLKESIDTTKGIYLSNKLKIKLSIIIVCTNYENLRNIIKSIYGQNFECFEIILIFDDKYEKVYNLIRNYEQSHQNIKIIINKVKKGKLYSISSGVLIAKGKYVLVLEQKCCFLSIDFSKNIFENIKNEDSDVLEFDLYKQLLNNYISLYKCNHYSSSVNLEQIKNNLLFDNIDIKKELMTNKIIKTKYLQNLVYIYKLNKIQKIVDYYYNEIFYYIIKTNPHKFNKLKSIYIFCNETDLDSMSFNGFISKQYPLINETIFYINFLFDNSKDTYESKNEVLQEFYNVLNILFNKFTNISISSLNLFQKFIDCKYISKSNKNTLKFYYNSLIS